MAGRGAERAREQERRWDMIMYVYATITRTRMQYEHIFRAPQVEALEGIQNDSERFLQDSKRF